MRLYSIDFTAKSKLSLNLVSHDRASEHYLGRPFSTLSIFSVNRVPPSSFVVPWHHYCVPLIRRLPLARRVCWSTTNPQIPVNSFHKLCALLPWRLFTPPCQRILQDWHIFFSSNVQSLSTLVASGLVFVSRWGASVREVIAMKSRCGPRVKE
jgi:hypothetical protein